jgi:hypothetical protein
MSKNKSNFIVDMFDVILVIVVLILSIGNCSAQVCSPNEEFYYEYVDAYQIVTGLNDTINTSILMPEGINDEGHPYLTQVFWGTKVVTYYAAPWIDENVRFVQYDINGNLIQSLSFISTEYGLMYSYYTSNNGRVSSKTSNKNFKSALKLWK